MLSAKLYHFPNEEYHGHDGVGVPSMKFKEDPKGTGHA